MKLCKLDFITNDPNLIRVLSTTIISGNITFIQGKFSDNLLFCNLKTIVSAEIETIELKIKLIDTPNFTFFTASGHTNLNVPINNLVVSGNSDEITISFTSEELIYGTEYTISFIGC